MKDNKNLFTAIKQSQNKILKIIFFPFLIIIFISLLVFSGFYVSDSASMINRNYSPNLIYWITVGDQFQIERTISKFNDSNQDWNMSLIYDDLKIEDTKKKKYLYLEYFFELNINKQDKAILLLKTRYPVIMIFFITVIILISFLLMLIPVKKSLEKTMNEFKWPLKRFTSSLSKVSNLDQNIILEENFSFVELNDMHQAVSSMYQRIKLDEKRIRELEKETIVADIIRQVSHDLVSPIMLQKTILNNVKAELSSSDFELLIMSVDRLESIAENVLKDYRPKKNVLEIEELENFIRQKRIEKNFSNIIFEVNLENPVSIVINKERLLSILSNLINNSIEALCKKITIELENNSVISGINFKISDDGKGIPEFLLDKIGLKGNTFNKCNGNGIGLYSAKKFVIENNGTFNIQSEENIGTEIEIFLPI